MSGGGFFGKRLVEGRKRATAGYTQCDQYRTSSREKKGCMEAVMGREGRNRTGG